MEIHRFQWIATREYETFSVWLIENAGQEVLYTYFRSYLESDLAAGGNPSRPVTHSWERYSPRRFSAHPLDDHSKDSSALSDADNSGRPSEVQEDEAVLGVLLVVLGCQRVMAVRLLFTCTWL